MIDLAGIGNLLEYLVAADNITCEERDRIILRIAKENDIAEYTLSALAGYGKSKSEVLESVARRKNSVSQDKKQDESYISLTEIARAHSEDAPGYVIQSWLRSGNTLALLNLWEQENNPDYSEAGYEELLEKKKAASFTLKTEYIRIHSSKMDVKLLQDIFFKLKHIDEDENWLYASPHTVNFYMTFLANHIAKKNSLSLWTRNQELWTTSTYFLYGGALQDDYRPGKEYIEPSTEALVSIMIPDIFPQDLLHVPPTDILRFREKRKDERNQFLNAIKTLRNELAQADAPEVIEAIINDEKKKIDSAANEYRKSMDILRVAKFGGILTTVITVAADVLGYCSNFPDLYKGAIESSGLWAGILTGIFEKRVGNINNPYTYLAQIKSTFSYYPGASKLFGGQPQIAKYNYTLYRGFDEFIND